MKIGALGSRELADQLSKIQESWDLRQWMREQGLMSDDECFDGAQIYKWGESRVNSPVSTRPVSTDSEVCERCRQPVTLQPNGWFVCSPCGRIWSAPPARKS